MIEIEKFGISNNVEPQDKTIEDNVIDMIWDIAKISPEYGNALMDVLGDDVYEKVMKKKSASELRSKGVDDHF